MSNQTQNPGGKQSSLDTLIAWISVATWILAFGLIQVSYSNL